VSRRRIYLMRHAEVAYFDGDGRPVRTADVTLTPAGREQARAAAAVFEGVRFDRVVTSGLARTLETARLVASRRRTSPSRGPTCGRSSRDA